MRLRKSPFSHAILRGQHNFEAILADQLSTLRDGKEFSTELKHLNQQADKVSGQIAHSGREESNHFSYLVGCDDRAGITRKFTYHDFESMKADVSLSQVDCKHSWRHLASMELMWMFSFDSGVAVVFPLPRNSAV
jgi:2-polyprenyl-6-methoxyphenol hydroxylase-like FAD-dependent oxidoreductase